MIQNWDLNQASKSKSSLAIFTGQQIGRVFGPLEETQDCAEDIGAGIYKEESQEQESRPAGISVQLIEIRTLSNRIDYSSRSRGLTTSSNALQTM